MIGPAGLETHGLGAKLVFDEFGLSPYWGVTSVFDPDHDTSLEAFEAIGETWTVESAKYWEGQIAPPADQDIEGGMNEYSYTLTADDGIGDKDVVVQFRPGFPGAMNVNSGDPMQGIPDDLPESVRVQIMSTNVTASEALIVLRSFAEEIDLNPEYFVDPHEWSRVYQFERYARIDRTVAEDRLTGDGAVIDQLAEFASGQSGRGSYKWDHGKIQGHYQAVAFDPDTWKMIMPTADPMGKAFKCYHPNHPRSSTDGDDPLSHPKIEISLSNEYDPDGSVAWTELSTLRADLDEAAANILSWGGVEIGAESEAWVDTDPYFDVDERSIEQPDLEIVQNPLPVLRDETQRRAEAALVAADPSDAHERLLDHLVDEGSAHYETLAEDADVGTSTVYRMLDEFSTILESDRGIVQFLDDVTRDHVSEIVSYVRDAADWASDSLRQVSRERTLLREDDGPLAKWMERHGVEIVETHPDLEFEIGRRLTERQVLKILRAGLEAAETSALPTERFEGALVSWRTRDGEPRRNWQVVIRSGRASKRLLGKVPADQVPR